MTATKVKARARAELKSHTAEARQSIEARAGKTALTVLGAGRSATPIKTAKNKIGPKQAKKRKDADKEDI